jgi:hypothetical protein
VPIFPNALLQDEPTSLDPVMLGSEQALPLFYHSAILEIPMLDVFLCYWRCVLLLFEI